MLLKILLIILCCYAFMSIVSSFIFIVSEYKKVIEETVSASLSKTLKDYNKYFKK